MLTASHKRRRAERSATRHDAASTQLNNAACSEHKSHDRTGNENKSVSEEETFLVAAVENRAKEIGIAVLAASRQKLLLSQFIETSRTYTTTLAFLHRFQPSPLLIVDETTKSRAGGLTTALRDAFETLSLPRSCFDDVNGELAIERLSARNSDFCQEGQLQSKRRHYLALGAAGALLAYYQDLEQHVITQGSLDVEFIGTEKHMQLDLMSIESLGLTRGGNGVERMSVPSLFSFMNRTKTSSGARLLKANLLQPLTHVPTLECRYEAVQELVENEELRSKCEEALDAVPRDLDKLCSVFTLHVLESTTEEIKSRKETLSCNRISSLVDGVILMKDTIHALHGLTDALRTAKSVLLTGICETLGNSVFEDILSNVCDVLDEQVHRQKTAALKRIEQCYAVKSGFDGFLDVARENFCKITEQIHALADKLQEQHHLANIKVSYNSKKGFSFLVTLSGKSVSSRSMIPDGWMVIEKRGRNGLHCVTHELIALNARLKDATHDCMLLTQQALEGLAEGIVQQMMPVRKMVDSVALLDLLFSLAELAATSPSPYTRPTLSSNGLLAISAGRHPVYETMPGIEFCPNDTFFSPFSTCHIITGPNMSGKSTYLKQVALMLIMAQIGSFVPAEQFLFCPRDKLFSRMGFADSVETNSSSFAVEMQEMAYILDHITPQSFVIVDELGRATSTMDGESIAWAVTEKLVEVGAYSLVATHFNDLPHLTQVYPCVRLYSLEVALSSDGLQFKWNLQSVSCSDLTDALPGNYGIQLAKVLGFPAGILQRAEEIAADYCSRRVALAVAHAQDDEAVELRTAHTVAQRLLCLVNSREHMEEGQQSEELRALRNLLRCGE